MNKKPTILVVDDTPQNLDLLVGILKQDYKVKVATGGQQALSVAGAGAAPDLILLDVQMPEMDGYEVCRRLQASVKTRSIPVIFVTGMDQETDETKGLELGAVDYITKPVSPAIVKARVKTHLKLKKAHNDIHAQNITINKQAGQLLDFGQRMKEKVKKQTDALEESFHKIIQLMISLLETRHPRIKGHGQRVSDLAGEIAIELDLPTEEAALIIIAGLLHDIGKLDYPDNLFQTSEAKMTPDERSAYQQHPVIGQELMTSIKSLEKTGVLIRHHHERLDGSGYPDGLRGDEIPLGARIIAVADVFDRIAHAGMDQQRHIDKYIDDLKISHTGGKDPGIAAQAAIHHLKEGFFRRYDPRVMIAFFKCMKKRGVSFIAEGAVPVERHKPGMQLTRPLHTRQGLFLLSAETPLTPEFIDRLTFLAQTDDPPDLVFVASGGEAKMNVEG